MTERQVLWQGHYGNYDDSGYTELFSDPVECLKAMGWIDRDGRPIDVRGDNIYWSLTAMPVYEDYEQARHDETPWTDVTDVARFNHWYLPMLIRKYEDGKRLDRHEQEVLGLR
jgi:hypothetical protein